MAVSSGDEMKSIVLRIETPNRSFTVLATKLAPESKLVKKFFIENQMLPDEPTIVLTKLDSGQTGFTVNDWRTLGMRQLHQYLLDYFFQTRTGDTVKILEE